MLNKLKGNKELLKIIGAVVVSIIVLYAWYTGFLGFIFYIFGFYVALYVISRLFKTSVILQFLLGIGGFLLYIIIAISLLWSFYIALKIMFEGSFFYGLLLIFVGIPIAQFLIYIIGGSIGAVLGMPLFWMIEDIDNRGKKNQNIHDAEVVEEIQNLEEGK